MENSDNSGKVFGALLLGAAIGGVLGILFAPDKGSRTRKKLFDQGSDIADELTGKFNDLMADGKREVLNKVKDKASEYVLDGKTTKSESKT